MIGIKMTFSELQVHGKMTCVDRIQERIQGKTWGQPLTIGGNEETQPPTDTYYILPVMYLKKRFTAVERRPIEDNIADTNLWLWCLASVMIKTILFQL